MVKYELKVRNNKGRIIKNQKMPEKNIVISGSGIMADLAQIGVTDELHFQVQPIIEGKDKQFL